MKVFWTDKKSNKGKWRTIKKYFTSIGRLQIIRRFLKKEKTKTATLHQWCALVYECNTVDKYVCLGWCVCRLIFSSFLYEYSCLHCSTYTLFLILNFYVLLQNEVHTGESLWEAHRILQPYGPAQIANWPLPSVWCAHSTIAHMEPIATPSGLYGVTHMAPKRSILGIWAQDRNKKNRKKLNLR